MPDDNPRHLPHIVIQGTAHAEAYAPRGRGPRMLTPPRDRRDHAASLLRQFRGVRTDLQALQEEREQLGFERRAGLTLQFESAPDFDLSFESLDAKSQGIQLLSVKKTEGKTVATCFVPDGKLDYFIKRIQKYRDEQTKHGKPKNRTLVESIEAVRLAAVDALWTDDRSRLPPDDELAWWEIWIRNDDEAALEELRRSAQTAGFHLSDERLSFPERRVITARCTKRQLSQSMRLVNSIAELREAKRTAADFIELPPREQREISDELLARISLQGNAVAACILDTGVAQAHPLLSIALQPNDCHSYKAAWGVNDTQGHGTEMAGIALHGNLVDVLTQAEPIELEHCLESVKILTPNDPNPPHLYGAVTIQSVRLAEQAAPDRLRAIAMAITAESLEQGEPSTWSAAVDALTSGYEDDKRRLIFVSAGNSPRENWHNHPEGAQQASVQDPGQSWNALTVGAYTELTGLPAEEFPDWHVVAQRGDVSPYSSTSCTWSRPWPIKPEIVLEGGNCAIDPQDHLAKEADALSLLTTNRRFNDRPFSLLMMTSAATGLAARFAAIIQARYPNLWPESVRGLIVNSAEWTDTIRRHFQPLNTREQKERLLRYCGYGVPNFERANWSASNELTLIAQDELQPFKKEGSDYKSKDINIHTLPWPTDILRGLGATEVELRVTLSYFIEPSPARRGWKGRYRYASHALRFEVKTATESENEFRKRVNMAARSEEENDQEYPGDAAQWQLGPYLRHLGSVHSDMWKGTAIDLANRNLIAVYPVVGWWRERPHLERWNRHARYSLTITIRTPSEEIDIYTPVQTQIEAAVQVATDEAEE